MLSRRTFLRSAALSALASAAPFSPPFGAPEALARPPEPVPVPPSLTRLELPVEGPRDFGRRFTLFVPTHLAPGERVPLLVLLHGLGEAGDPQLGIHAWHDRYGLGSAYDRLLKPPIHRTSTRPDIRDDQLAALNASLRAKPFAGMAIACPFTPNLARMPNPAGAHEAYATWLCEVLIPRARQHAPVVPDAAHTQLDGCSMGGPIGLEILTKRPDHFSAWGSVQSAFGAQRAKAFAERLAAAWPKMARVPGAAPAPAIYLETSKGDMFCESNALLSRELKSSGVPHDFLELPGPHDQPWLREAGTLAMLLWHDQRPR
jgi:hypothetical protein